MKIEMYLVTYIKHVIGVGNLNSFIVRFKYAKTRRTRMFAKWQVIRLEVL
jgi:hypothetical protein